MNAVYRIDVEHRPQDGLDKEWYAKATRISDDAHMMGSGAYGHSSDEAIQEVQRWIAAEASRQEGFSVYTDEYGNVAADSVVARISDYSTKAS